MTQLFPISSKYQLFILVATFYYLLIPHLSLAYPRTYHGLKHRKSVSDVQLTLPINKLAASTSLSLCPEQKLVISENLIHSATAGLKIFSKRLTEQARTGANSLSDLLDDNGNSTNNAKLCLPALSLYVPESIGIEVATEKLAELSLGAESVICAQGKAYLRTNYNSSELYSVRESLIYTAQQFESNRSVSGLKLEIKKLRVKKINQQLSKQAINNQISKLQLEVEQAKLVLDHGPLVASYFESLCKQSLPLTSGLLQRSSTELLEYNSDDPALDPVIGHAASNLDNIKVNVSVVLPSNNSIASKLSAAYNQGYDVAWNFFSNGKYYNTKYYRYPPGTFVRFYITNFASEKQNYFFKGFEGAPCREGVGNPEIGECSFYLNGHTEINTRFQSCAEMEPDTFYFNSIIDFERKMLLFARNNPDSRLKIRAKGEVAGLPVVYSNGKVCAKFFEGQQGAVSLSYDTAYKFMKPYAVKNIHDLIHYHTHDGNSSRTTDSIIGWSVDNNGKWLGPPGTVPSMTDFILSLDLKRNFAGIFRITTKVISSAGNGYTYDMPLSFKAAKFEAKAEEIIANMNKIKFRSVNKKQTVHPHIKDMKAALDYFVTQLKKYGLILKPFNIN